MHLLALAGREADDGARMILRLLGRVLLQLAVGESGHILERLVELNDEIVLEIAGHSAAVARGVARNAVVGGVDLDMRAAVESVDHHIRIFRLGEREAEQRRAVGGRQLHHHVVLGQIYFIVVCFGLLALVREPARALVLVELGRADHGHERELAEVVDPRAGLVRLLESAYLVIGVHVLPSVTHLSRLGSPEVHTPRTRDGRVCVTGGEFERRLRADQRIHVIDGRKLLLLRSRGEKRSRGEQCENTLFQHKL